MASVEDFIDNDGVLRSLLSKTIDDTVYALYPKTNADVVKYKESTVEMVLESMNNILTNIRSNLVEVTSNLNELSGSTYNKTYISSVLDQLNETIDNNSANIINIKEIINSMSYYTQDEITQKFMSLTQDINKSINYTNTIVQELSKFSNLNFITKQDLIYKLEANKQEIIELQSSLEDLINSNFRQIALDLDERILKDMNNFYKFEDINTEFDSVYGNIDSIENDMSILRGDMTSMNGKTENNVNNHIDQAKNNMINNTNNKISQLQNVIDINNTNQNSKIDQNQIQLLSSLGKVSSNVNFKLEQIIMQLTSIGASNPVLPAYESADLEVY